MCNIGDRFTIKSYVVEAKKHVVMWIQMAKNICDVYSHLCHLYSPSFNFLFFSHVYYMYVVIKLMRWMESWL